MTGNLKKAREAVLCTAGGLVWVLQREPWGCGTWVCVHAHTSTHDMHARTHIHREREVFRNGLS